MTMGLLAPGRRRYVVPGAVAAMTAAVVAVPQLATGQSNPVLPARTAAQLLSALEHVQPPDFSGTVVATTRLGLPSLSDAGLAGIAAPDAGLIGEITNLLVGSHTVQLAYGGPERQRVAIFLDDLSETDIVHNGADIWTYSSTDNSVSHTVNKPRTATQPDVQELPGAATAVDPQQAAQKALAAIDPSTAVTVDRTAHVAGRSAYQLVLRPRDANSLIGSVRIAIDATTSLPLRVQVWPLASTTTPALQVAFTSVSFTTPAAATFAFKAPPDAVMKSGPFALNPKTLGTRRGVRPFAGRTAKAAGQVLVPALGAAPAVASKPDVHVTGKDWLSVLVATTPSLAVPDGPDSAPTALQQLTAALNQLATPVAGGRLLRTALLSVLLTNDGRLFVGAVSPRYLEQLAAGQT